MSVLIAVGLAIGFIWLISDSYKRYDKKTAMNNLDPLPCILSFSSDAYEVVGDFAKLVNDLCESEYFHQTKGYDKLFIQIGWNEGEYFGTADIFFYTDTNLERILKNKKIELDKETFCFSEDKRFLHYHKDRLIGMEEWLGYKNTIIKIHGRENVLHNNKLLDTAILSVVSTVQNNLPRAEKIKATGSYYTKDGEVYLCSVNAEFYVNP